MKVYKFGGASVKDVKSIENFVKIVSQFKTKKCLIVVSAMGKMTNAFEEIVDAYFKNTSILSDKIACTKEYHFAILNELFIDKEQSIFDEILQIYMQISGFLATNTTKDYNYVYDQVVSNAEIISTKILSHYLKVKNVENSWLDAREYIKTDTNYRRANVDFEQTKITIKPINTNAIYITQGFIASAESKKTTTLGREGSDYSAAIFASCLQAESLTIFKDVAGVLNADPKWFEDTILLEKISYKEAIEMAFYGASVIHPKTIQPLKNATIPLYVKSFINPKLKGTVIKNDIKMHPKVPCFIEKKAQILLSITTKDFSFIDEKNISEIFGLMHTFRLKANLIQNTAISFTICLEDVFNTFSKFLKQLQVNYKGKYNNDVKLLTIRHFTANSIAEIEKNNNVLLKQTTRETVQFIVK